MTGVSEGGNKFWVSSNWQQFIEPYIDMRPLKIEIWYEKCVVRRFRRCAKVIECTYTNLGSIAYYTLRLYGIAYRS